MIVSVLTLLVLLTPLLLLLILNLVATFNSTPFRIIEGSLLQDEEKVKAIQSLKKARTLCLKGLIYDITAPYVMLFVLPFVKWEAEKLPSLFSKWDNEVSLNGDRGYWINSPEGIIRLPAPLEDTPEVRETCYYAEGHHPRSFWARYVWLGWRNRASKQAYDAGVEITDELRASYKEWGNPSTGEVIDGALSTGYLIRNCGEYFEVYSNEVKGSFIKRVRYGYKIGNALKGDVVYFRKAMPVAIGISFKRNKNA